MGYPEEPQTFNNDNDANFHDDISEQQVESTCESGIDLDLSQTRQRRQSDAHVPGQCAVMERLVLRICAVSLFQSRVRLPWVFRDKSHLQRLAVSRITAYISVSRDCGLTALPLLSTCLCLTFLLPCSHLVPVCTGTGPDETIGLYSPILELQLPFKNSRLSLISR